MQSDLSTGVAVAVPTYRSLDAIAGIIGELTAALERADAQIAAERYAGELARRPQAPQTADEALDHIAVTIRSLLPLVARVIPERPVLSVAAKALHETAGICEHGAELLRKGEPR